MSEKPLWSDKTIDECFSDDDELHYAMRMRDEYEAHIAQLERKLSETWQPLPNGEIQLNGFERITVKDGWIFSLIYAAKLPDDISLCRKAATVVVDWEKYSEEWKWFAVDSDGGGHIYLVSPDTKIDYAYWFSGYACMNAGRFNLNYIDWRATLTERPNQPKGVARI